MKRSLVLLVIAVAACRTAPPESPLDEIVPPILAEDRIPAAVILVGSVAEGVTYRRAFGDARPDTIFDMASCTKVVATTTAAMKLVEEGKLAVDDPVGRHLSCFNGRPLTLRDLLTHDSGLPAYLKPKGASPDAILGEISSLRADGKFRYS
jgi:CubicO group peptidase (beta-lactamase class C family)